MIGELLGRRIERRPEPGEQLQRRAPHGQTSDRPETLDVALEELRTSAEELLAANDESRQPGDELTVASAQVAIERQRYYDLFDMAPDGYLVTDEHGTIREANRAAARLLGTPVHFMAGKLLAAFVVPADRTGLRTQLNLVSRGAQLSGWEVRLCPREGEPFDASLSVTALRDRAGKKGGLLWLVHDVSVRKQAEQQIRALNAQLEAANLQKDDLLVREREALAIVSHDLKSPLTVIRAYAQLVKLRLDAPASDVGRLRHGLDQICAMVTKMTGQIDELVDVARLQLGEALPLELQPTDLVALTKQVTAVFQETTKQHHILVEATTPALVGNWDSARIERVLANLLSNAIKFSRGGGDILIRVSREERPEGDAAVVSIRDRGIGIPAADLPHIFELFRRGRNGTGRISGTGVGLASARQVVEQHGGDIEVISHEGVGSTFTVKLPLTQPNQAVALSAILP